jgi:hypothetical protein
MIRIGYHRAWGPVMLVCAAINAALYAMTGSWVQLALGVMLGVVGVLYLTMPFLVVGDGQIQAKNMMGITLRRFPFEDLADLEVSPGAVVITSPRGGRQRLKVSRWLVSGADMRRLADAVDAARAARAANT